MALALALWLVFRSTFVAADLAYGLLWGGDILDGRVPDYAEGPAPHPLVNLIALPLALLGDRGETATAALNYLSLAGLVTVSMALTARVAGRVAALLIALLLLSRPTIVLTGVVQYADTLTAALCIGAVLVLTSRPQATWTPLLLLSAAGLLRPEAWVLTALLAAIRVRGARPPLPGLLALAAAVAAAPVLWALADLAVTGDPLYSFNFTQATGRPSEGSLEVARSRSSFVRALPRTFVEVTGGIEALLGSVGIGILLWRAGRQVALVAAIVVLPLGLFGVEALLRTPIVGRYLILPGVGVLIALAAVCGSGRLVRADAGARRVWQVAAAGCLVVVAVLGISRVGGIDDGRREFDVLQRGHDDAQGILQAQRPARRCGEVAVPSNRLIPIARQWLRRPAGSVVLSQLDRPTRGTYLVPRRTDVRRAFFVETIARDDPRQLLVGPPPGFERTAANRSWELFQRC